MRIQLGEHALDRAGQQLFVFNRIDVALLDVAEYLGQGLDFRQRQRAARLALRDGRKVKTQQQAGCDAKAYQTRFLPFADHVALPNATVRWRL